MKKCRYCNMSYGDDIFICPNCNTKLPEKGGVPTLEKDIDDKTKRIGTIVFIASCFTCLIPIIIGYFVDFKFICLFYFGFIGVYIFFCFAYSLGLHFTLNKETSRTYKISNDRAYFNFKIKIACILVFINIVSTILLFI